jgi:crotonobetainyl-CoA:carnitine CoA-transferase CaiB-like acyl-CoA transferase
LRGLRVLDLTRLLPGPLCTMHLADMGAEVIKIEDPEHGDGARELGSGARRPAALFQALNRNKRGLQLDLKSPQGAAVFLRLAETADVVVEGFRPGVVDRLGVDYQSTRSRNSAIVYCAITGYGQDGPYRDRAGHDVNYCGYAGVLDQIGPRGEAPVIPNFQIADIVGGALSAAMGILAALVGAKTHGHGRYLDIAMTDCLLANATIPLAALTESGAVPARGDALLSGGVPCYSIYPTRDGRFLAVGALEAKFWERLCEALGRPDLVTSQFATGDDGDRVRKSLESVFRTRDRDAWETMLAPVDCCISPVLSVAEALRNDQIGARGLVRPGVDEQLQVASPIRFGDTLPPPLEPAPDRGRDTDAILAETGFAMHEIDRLRNAGVI